MKALTLLLICLASISFLGSCDRGGDPDMPLPSTPPREDAIIGNYMGICRTEEIFFDFQTGQSDTLRDTFPGEMKILDVDSISATGFTIYTEGLFFEAFFRLKGNFLDDTMYVQNYQSVHTEDLAIVPAEQLVIRSKITQNQTGPGSSFLQCMYIKVE